MDSTFLSDNYVWIIVIAVVVVMTVIGYIADKTKFGSKFCEYCGSGVEPVNIKVWSLRNYELTIRKEDAKKIEVSMEETKE